MDVLLRSFGVLVPATLLTLPVAVLAWRSLAALRSRNRPAAAARITAALDVAIVVLGALVLVVVSMPFSTGSALHLLPGTDLEIALTDNTSFWQVTANVVMLLPLGLLLPLRWAWWRVPGRVTVAALLASVAIEAMQFVIDAGRVSSADDVLLNTVGAAAGAGLTRRTELNRRLWSLCLPRLVPPPAGRPRHRVPAPRARPPATGVALLSGRRECPYPGPVADRRSRTPTG